MEVEREREREIAENNRKKVSIEKHTKRAKKFDEVLQRMYKIFPDSIIKFFVQKLYDCRLQAAECGM